MEDLTKGKTTSEEDSSISSSASAGAAPSSSVPVYKESVEVSDVLLRASDLARALKLTERSSEKYGERTEAQKVESRIEAQIRVAAEEEEEARSRLLDILICLGRGRSLLLGTCLQRVRRGLGCHTQGVGSGEGAKVDGEIG